MSTKRNNSWVLVGKDGRTHDLSHGMIFIGREECDIVLQAASADKRHAVLCYNNSEQKFHIKDLNSLTGTYVNGIRIAEQTYVKLKRLDCIRFGYGPDVFYLEKSSNATSPHVEHDDVSVTEEESVEQNSCNTRNVDPNADSEQRLACQSPHASDLPSMVREDPPPDTLNLSNAKQRQKEWDWIGHDGTLSDSPDYSQKSETSSCSAPPNYATNNEDRDAGSAQSSPAATAFTIAFENEAVTPRKKLGIRDSISKFAPSKNENENRVSFQQKNSKSEPSPKKLPLADAKSSIPKSRSQFPYTDLKDIEGFSKISDSASFLIKKMLNGQMSPSDIPEELPHHREKSPLQSVQNDANDDHSEAGTYTVDTDQADCDVEEARKKIDEVFGVIQLSNSVLSSSYSSSTSSSAAKQIPRLNGRLKQTMLKNPLPKQRETSIHWNGVNKNYSRSKPTAPSPAISNESLCRTETLPPHSLHRSRKPCEVPSTPDKIRRSKIVTTPKSPGKPRAPSTLKSPGSLSNNLSAVTSSRESCNKEEQICRRPADSRSEGSKSPHTSAQWQKVPWNLSGSDLDLDRSKSENNSILSDTSTEPSSHSSHSSKSRPEQGPQMRLNRAFALRRARLEAESSKRGKENRLSTTSSSQKSMKKSAKLSGSASTLREESSTKMNFHITPAITKPFPTRQMVQCSNPRSDPMKRKVELKGGGHRRIESDPGKSIAVWKTDLRSVASSTVDEKVEGKKVTVNQSFDDSRLQTFHRSVSCSIVNETDVPKSNLFRGPTHREFPASFIKNFDHSIICGSQLVASHNADDYSSRNQNKEITALDALVISAIHQLSSKLWMNSKELLEKERKKCPKGSDTWLMIDEVLPQVPVTGTPEDGDFTKDLSSILKNLKRVEQGLEVLSSVLENNPPIPEANSDEKQSLPNNFFIVDM